MTRERFKNLVKDSFLGNECDTDEYRETQPEKGLDYVREMLSEGSYEGARRVEIIGQVGRWLTAYVKGYTKEHGYGGTGLLRVILDEYVELLWANGELPYGETWDEWWERTSDDDEGEQDGDV